MAWVRLEYCAFVRLLLLIGFVSGLFGCYAPLKKEAQRPEDALAPTRYFFPTFHDDLNFDSLAIAIKRNFEYLDKLDPTTTFTYGPYQVTAEQVRRTQDDFLEFIKKNPGPEEIKKEIRNHYLLLRATGRAGNPKVLFTGYFEPLFHGSLTPDETFKYPLYGRPDDLLIIDLSLFSDKFEGMTITARMTDNQITPYYSRFQIEMEKSLEGRKLEIAWMKDRVDVAFLHIQGSGRLVLPDGDTVSVGYQASNGRPYHSIGRYLLKQGLMKRDQISMQGIRKFLSDNPEMIDEVLNHNPSYVFFRTLERGPLGNIGVPITPGRSLALDSRLFPKGALAFVSCKKPVVDKEGAITEWRPFSRFVLNQDTGGAIKGAGRADLFWGNGPYAELAAGHMNHEGMVYILIKKP
ncbi:MAG: MltA domain-containing protein [Thermodesulfobacteriota bacterium]|nr:MltA domain-containing protein [Thermodesulfobacteriota bacterium]